MGQWYRRYSSCIIGTACSVSGLTVFLFKIQPHRVCALFRSRVPYVLPQKTLLPVFASVSAYNSEKLGILYSNSTRLSSGR